MKASFLKLPLAPPRVLAVQAPSITIPGNCALSPTPCALSRKAWDNRDTVRGRNVFLAFILRGKPILKWLRG